jgi:hypothetical protein
VGIFGRALRAFFEGAHDRNMAVARLRGEAPSVIEAWHPSRVWREWQSAVERMAER